MMKRALIFSLLSLIIFTAIAQPKTRGRVKRKYRNVERVNENLPQVVFSGLVRDAAKIPIPGASVEIEGLNRRVHTNESGQFMLSDLPTGRLRLKVSCLGYRTKTLDYVLQVGFNDHYVALDREKIYLEPLTVTARSREQQIPDIPASVSGITQTFSEQLNITGFSGMADYLPGIFYEDLGAGKSAFSIQGTTSGAGFPFVSPSVALYSDEVPVIQSGGFSSRFLDMERIEVLKGSQNLFFGKHALKGAIHFLSKKPQPGFGGYVTAGGGNFGAKEVESAVNVPVLKDMLFIRAAGIYTGLDGYVKNTMGGTLNGKNNLGGRFSMRFLPAYNHMVDLSMNYRNDQNSGVAYMNQWFPDENGETGLFNYRTSLNGGRQSG
jgi:iron complex outermembrane recepter protein